MVLQVLRGVATRARQFFSTRPGAAASAGVAGGVLVDDVPFIGSSLDPTEGSNNLLFNLLLIAVLVIGATVAMDTLEID